MLKRIAGLVFAALLVAAIFHGRPASALDLSIDGNIRLQSGTATATAGAATLANKAGKITSEALTTAAGVAYTLTITNTAVAAADICLSSVANGTNTQGVVVINRTTAAAGSLVIVATNEHASQALNGTLVFNFVCFKP